MASSAWERRNARARALGFKNYYEQRTRKTPGAPKPSSEELRRRRGHAGPSDLNRLLRSGRVELINVVQTGYSPPTFDLLCRMDDGTQRSFVLRGEAPVRKFRATIDALGADAPQMTGSGGTLNRLLRDADEEELEAAELAGELELEEPEEGGEMSTFSDDDIPF